MQRLLTWLVYAAVLLVLLPMLPFVWVLHYGHGVLNERKP
jgi:hypothetical protein